MDHNLESQLFDFVTEYNRIYRMNWADSVAFNLTVINCWWQAQGHQTNEPNEYTLCPRIVLLITRKKSIPHVNIFTPSCAKRPKSNGLYTHHVFSHKSLHSSLFFVEIARLNFVTSGSYKIFYDNDEACQFLGL